MVGQPLPAFERVCCLCLMLCLHPHTPPSSPPPRPESARHPELQPGRHKHSLCSLEKTVDRRYTAALFPFWQCLSVSFLFFLAGRVVLLPLLGASRAAHCVPLLRFVGALRPRRSAVRRRVGRGEKLLQQPVVFLFASSSSSACLHCLWRAAPSSCPFDVLLAQGKGEGGGAGPKGRASLIPFTESGRQFQAALRER